MTKGALAAGLRELAARGFISAGFRGTARIFHGEIASRRGPLPALIWIDDWEFLEYPTIIVIDGLKKFPQLRPHLDALGGLCYLARRSVVLDRYDVGNAIAQCLEQGQAVLNSILTDRAYLEMDVQNEFLVHWERAQPPPLSFHLANVNAGAKFTRMHFDQAGERAILSDDARAAQDLAAAVGWGAISEGINRCWLFYTNVLPPVPERFAENVRELFDWLRLWDRRLYNAVQHHLTTAQAYEFNRLVMAVRTPVGWIGFIFDVPPSAKITYTAMKAYLHGRGRDTSLRRLAISDLSPAFVHSRNLTFPDLTDKRVTLLGCGAVGSQLAAALVRLGAGQGSKGLLRLIDEERLEVENLGRHYLGYNCLNQSKAKALREELYRQFPLVTLEDVSKNVQDLRGDVMQADLLIDATGDQAVSEFLNAKWLEQGRPVPILYVWIKGNGECVQSLWTDTPDHACFRCLWVPDPQVYRRDRYPVLKRLPQLKRLGCHAFTPYAVSSPMQAAALAIDAICDWLQGRVTPRLRTRYRENVDVHHVENLDPQPLLECPACAHP